MRQSGAVNTADFNRNYTDVCSTYGTWTLYDWLAFADVWFFLVCKDITFDASCPPRSKKHVVPDGVRRAATFT